MNATERESCAPDNIPSDLLDLLLDVVLEVMRAERGSIMLLDENSQDLVIQSARGLKSEIVKKARVRLGSGISGKVAAGNESVFLHGISGERRLQITAEDMVDRSIDTSYIIPLRLPYGVVGSMNVSSLHTNHGISSETGRLAQGVIARFFEYLAQIDLPPSHHESPSQLYMMNVFREYGMLRELRTVFDYVFHLVAGLLDTARKGVVFLKNPDSGFFDLILGYGLDTHSYREVYEELARQFKEPRHNADHEISIFHRRDLFQSQISSLSEEFFILLPMTWQEEVRGQVLIFADHPPEIRDEKRLLLQKMCETAGRTIGESAAARKFHELGFTDSLTGTYNYGLWLKRLKEELSRAHRPQGAGLSVIVLDIDHFDRINRSQGFYVGDELLRLVADRIKSCVRVMDVVGRIGGEEFGLVLPGASKNDAMRVGERILEAVSHFPAELRIDLAHPLTVSGGLATSDHATEPENIVENAKTALVAAKIMGGNCIKAFDHQEE